MANNIKGITIELGANTTALSKALDGVNKQSQNIAKELKQVENGLKFSPKSTELLSQKQKLLGDQVGATKEKLDKLKSAQDQVKKQYEAGEIDEGQYRAFQREIVETESKLKRYEGQLKSVNKENNAFSQKLEVAAEKLQKVGKKMQDIGANMSKKVTAPIMAGFAGSIVAFKEVDGALDTIVTKTGATGEAMQGFEASFRKVGKNIPAGLQKVGDAIGEINTQFGFTDEKLEKASEQMIKFSEINGQDVTTSTIASKGAIEAFGLSANDLGNVLDSVTKTAQGTGVSTDKLFDSVVKGAPQLKALGLDFSQATEVMGRFEQKGLDSSKALSYMSKAQVTFAKEGKTLSQGLEDLVGKIQNSKSETEQLTLASQYFGTKGATFMLDAIKRGALDFKGFEDASKNAEGAVSQTFEGTLDPIDKFKVAMNNVKIAGADVATTLQSTLAPMADKLVAKLQNFSEWFKNLSPQTQEMIVKIALMTAAIGPLLIIGGKIAAGIGSIITLFSTVSGAIAVVTTGAAAATPAIGTLAAVFTALTGPVGIVIGVIAGLIAVGVLLYKNWDTIKEKATQLGSWLGEKWNGIKEKTAETWNNMKEKTSAVWGAMQNKVQEHGGGIKGLIGLSMETYKNIWSNGFSYMDNITGGKLGNVLSNVGNKMSSIKDRIANSGIAKAWDSIWNFKMPRIPTPHFSFSGKFSVMPPSIPKFQFDGWYDKGGIFNSPSIIGVDITSPAAEKLAA